MTGHFAQTAPMADLSRGLEAGTIRLFPTDVTDRDAVEHAEAEIESAWGVPHLLVNNAAIDTPPDAPEAEVGPCETYPLDASVAQMRAGGMPNPERAIRKLRRASYRSQPN